MPTVLLNPYRFGAAAPAFAPTDLPNLSSWYDPSDTGARTIVSTAFSALTNKQGTSARDLAQATSGSRPALVTGGSGINGRDAMSLDGTDDWMGHSAPNLYQNGSSTIAAVFRAAPQNDKHTIGETSSGATNIGSFYRTQATNVNGAPDAYFQIDGGTVLYGGFSDGTVALLESTLDNHVLVVTDSGTALTHYVDGFSSSTHSITHTTMPGLDSFTVGCLRFNGGTFTFFVGLIGEIVCCTSALGTTDRQKLEGYMAHKWGAADELDGAHPYKAAPP